jgi:serine protease Do
MKRYLAAILFLAIGVGVGTLLVGSWSQGQPQPAPVLPRELTSYRDVVKRVLPAVVSIETRAANKQGPVIIQFPNDPRLPPGDPNRLGFGSGFIADPSGVVVTNYHVVEGAEIATVLLEDGRKFNSKNIRSDRRTDVAVILLDVKDGKFPTLDFGDSDAMEIGDRVLAVGAPFGLAGSVTQGIISAKGRAGLHMNMYEDFLQTDAAINPGNSGGPLVNLEGKVVGINAAIKSKSGGFQGVGLAVASNLVKNIVPALRTDGVVKRGYLGIQVRELAPEIAARLGVPKDGAGVVVADVYDKTPAAKADLQAGDILTHINANLVKDGAALQRIVAATPIGKALRLDLLRAGKALDIVVTIEEQPADYGVSTGAPAPRIVRQQPPSAALEALGVDVAELTPEFADDLGFRKGMQGVVITKMQEAGLAALNDLRRGTLISKIDGQSVATPAAAQQALQKADLANGVLLQVATPQGGVNYVLVKSAR